MNVDLKLKNAPIDVEIDAFKNDLMITFKADTYQTFLHNLTDKELKNYLKEIKMLLKDFDDIYMEINKKYELTEM